MARANIFGRRHPAHALLDLRALDTTELPMAVHRRRRVFTAICCGVYSRGREMRLRRPGVELS